MPINRKCKYCNKIYNSRAPMYCSVKCSVMDRITLTGREYEILADYRFWSCVKIENNNKSNCWEWTGHTCRGYGKLFYKTREVYASQYSYLIHFNVKINGKRDICHKCDNPLCVNPDHLFIGTRKENVRDCINKGRFAKGEKKSNAKFSNSEADIVRKKYNNGEKVIDLAEKYNVNSLTIYNIINYKTYN